MIDFFSSDELVEPKRGDLLISEPYLPDPNFERTVVLICEHNENGTVGFVLNKPATIGLGEAVQDLSHVNADLFVGGPVQQDTLHFLHRSELLKDKSNLVADKIYWGGDFDKLSSLADTGRLERSDIRFFIGYSGWSEGQLLNELKEKSWIVYQNPSSSLIFDSTAESLWKHVLHQMGGKFKLISNYPTDPRLN